MQHCSVCEKYFYSLTNTDCIPPDPFLPSHTWAHTSRLHTPLSSPILSICLSFFPTLSPSLIPISAVDCLNRLSHYSHYNSASIPSLSSLAGFMSLHNFLFHFLEASCAHHPSTNDCQYILEQSHFPQIAPIELLMVILGSLQVRVCTCVSACVLVLICPVVCNSYITCLCPVHNV